MVDELFDWLGREGWIVFNWWLLVTLAGWTVFPMLARLLSGLPDRGYALAKPAGVLLIAYTFWLLAILGFVQNTAGNMLLAWLIVAVIVALAYFRSDAAFDWRQWWRENSRAIVMTEVLFAVLLLGWAIYRAHQNDLTTTEKPMDLAFMSASQRSLTYPPDDPWLAGFAISYYYFGYVMAAMMSTLSGIRTTIGYNMHVALIFALAGTTAFGIVYNLVRSRTLAAMTRMQSLRLERGQTSAILAGMVALVFMVLMGSYQLPLLENPYFSGDASQSYLDFWDVNLRREPVTATDIEAPGSDPTGWGYWWWFRSARAISDRGLDGSHSEVIAEFPNFSFVLGDSHPHVMALPFALLAMGLAVNVLLSAEAPDRRRILFYGLCLGGLIFLNTWDAPIYLGLLLGAEGLRRLRMTRRLTIDDFMQIALLGLILLVIMVVAYLPFLLGFRSQLGGVLPNLVNPTQFPQIFLLFGPLLLIMLLYLCFELWRGWRDGTLNWILASQIILGIIVALLAGLVAFTLLGMASDTLRRSALSYIDANGGPSEVLRIAFERRFDPKALFTLIIGFVVLWMVLARLFPQRRTIDDEETLESVYAPATGFALLLIGLALVLILVPEFVYLRDNFGTRMNTVFKFYYQAWAALSVACAYGVYMLLGSHDAPLASPVRVVVGLLLIAIVAPAMLYPVYAIRERAWIESGLQSNPARGLTLDGGPGFVALDANRDDYAAIMCLDQLVAREPDVTVAEAERDTYRPYYGRVGALTGIPVVANWLGHQGQWRGEGYGEAVGTRRADLNLLYTDLRFEVVLGVLEKYGIDYILYGSTERRDFGSVGEEKFLDNLPVVCESGQSRIFAVPENLSAVASTSS